MYAKFGPDRFNRFSLTKLKSNNIAVKVIIFISQLLFCAFINECFKCHYSRSSNS
jgi:hypothetical protein